MVSYSNKRNGNSDSLIVLIALITPQPSSERESSELSTPPYINSLRVMTISTRPLNSLPLPEPKAVPSSSCSAVLTVKSMVLLDTSCSVVLQMTTKGNARTS